MTYRLFDELEYLKRRLTAAEGEIAHVKLRIDIVEQSLFSSLEEVDGLPVIVAHIIYQEANEAGTTVEGVRSESRSATNNQARAMAIFRIRELGQFSWAKMEKFFAGRTRSQLESDCRRGRDIAAGKNTKEKGTKANDRHQGSTA